MNNVVDVTCNFCFECMKPYSHFSASSILNMVIASDGNGNGREWKQVIRIHIISHLFSVIDISVLNDRGTSMKLGM